MKTEGTTQTHISPPLSKGWAALSILPPGESCSDCLFSFTGRGVAGIDRHQSYLRSVIVPLSFMMVFYVNYFLLVNRYLFSRHGWKFFPEQRGPDCRGNHPAPADAIISRRRRFLIRIVRRGS